MKLQAFNGGLQTRVHPILVGPTQSTVMDNVHTDGVILQPCKKPGSTALAGVQKYAYYFDFKDQWVSSSKETHYVEYDKKLYLTRPNEVPQIWDGFSYINMGIKPPLIVPTAATGAPGVLNDTYTYVITYYNSSNGHESGPSFVSNEVTPALDTVDLTGLPVSPDPQVSHKRIYRVGGSLTDFSLVASIPNANTSYNDNIADTAIPGNILDTDGYNQAPHGAQYIIEAYSMMFAAVENKVYFTPIGIPWAWPTLFFQTFNSEVTGLTVTNAGILVHMKNTTDIITGSSPETLSKYPFDSSQGSVSHLSHMSIGNVSYWTSNDGICGSTGGKAKVMSKANLGYLSLQPIASAVHNEVGYLLHSTGLLAMDLKYNAHFKNYTIEGLEHIVAGNDKLYGYINGAYYEMFAGEDDETFTYITGKFTEGAYTNRKNYKHLWVSSEGQVTVKVYIDDTLVNTWELTTKDTHDLDVVQSKKNGYSIQIELSGTTSRTCGGR